MAFDYVRVPCGNTTLVSEPSRSTMETAMMANDDDEDGDETSYPATGTIPSSDSPPPATDVTLASHDLALSITEISSIMTSHCLSDDTSVWTVESILQCHEINDVFIALVFFSIPFGPFHFVSCFTIGSRSTLADSFPPPTGTPATRAAATASLFLPLHRSASTYSTIFPFRWVFLQSVCQMRADLEKLVSDSLDGRRHLSAFASDDRFAASSATLQAFSHRSIFVLASVAFHDNRFIAHPNRATITSVPADIAARPTTIFHGPCYVQPPPPPSSTLSWTTLQKLGFSSKAAPFSATSALEGNMATDGAPTIRFVPALGGTASSISSFADFSTALTNTNKIGGPKHSWTQVFHRLGIAHFGFRRDLHFGFHRDLHFGFHHHTHDPSTAAMILANAEVNQAEDSVDIHVLPATQIGCEGALHKSYAKSTRNPTAKIITSVSDGAIGKAAREEIVASPTSAAADAFAGSTTSRTTPEKLAFTYKGEPFSISRPPVVPSKPFTVPSPPSAPAAATVFAGGSDSVFGTVFLKTSWCMGGCHLGPAQLGLDRTDAAVPIFEAITTFGVSDGHADRLPGPSAVGHVCSTTAPPTRPAHETKAPTFGVDAADRAGEEDTNSPLPPPFMTGLCLAIFQSLPNNNNPSVAEAVIRHVSATAASHSSDTAAVQLGFSIQSLKGDGTSRCGYDLTFHHLFAASHHTSSHRIPFRPLRSAASQHGTTASSTSGSCLTPA